MTWPASESHCGDPGVSFLEVALAFQLEMRTRLPIRSSGLEVGDHLGVWCVPSEAAWFSSPSTLAEMSRTVASVIKSLKNAGALSHDLQLGDVPSAGMLGYRSKAGRLAGFFPRPHLRQAGRVTDMLRFALSSTRRAQLQQQFTFPLPPVRGGAGQLLPPPLPARGEASACS